MPVSSIFLNQQLKYISEEVDKQDFPEMLMASGSAINISDELPIGAKTYGYKILTFVGEAAILGNGSSDIPMVNAFVEERVGYLRTITDGYELTLEDLEHAEFARMNIDAEMATGAREIVERKLDILGYVGDSDFNLLGLINFPNVPNYAVLNDGNQNGGSNSTQWRHKTPEQIYRDLRDFVSATRIATNSVENPEVVALPQAEFDIVLQTPYPNNSASGETIGSFFLKAQRATPAGVQAIVPMPYLAGRGSGGGNLMISYRKRMNKVKFHVPLAFEQRPPQERDLCIRTILRARTGGVEIRKPLSLRYAEGI